MTRLDHLETLLEKKARQRAKKKKPKMKVSGKRVFQLKGILEKGSKKS